MQEAYNGAQWAYENFLELPARAKAYIAVFQGGVPG